MPSPARAAPERRFAATGAGADWLAVVVASTIALPVATTGASRLAAQSLVQCVAARDTTVRSTLVAITRRARSGRPEARLAHGGLGVHGAGVLRTPDARPSAAVAP